jgi:peptide/nickel transport system substrate-binding protein
MLDTVLFGRGEIGNDLFSLGFPDYAADIAQRAHDPVEAQRLLAEAGAEDLAVTLRTGPESPGMVEAATLYAQQLGDVGVDVTIDELPPGQLFADFATYTSAPFVAGYSTAAPALLYYQVVFLGGGPYAFGWNRPDVDRLVLQARGTADTADRSALAAQVQQAQWDEGNTIIPVFKPVITARVPGLTGIEEGLFTQYPSFAEVRLT